MMSDEEINRINQHLKNLSQQEIDDKNKEHLKRNELDFELLKTKLSQGKCCYCKNPITYMSRQKPCLHWLLQPKRFKKKYFPPLYQRKSFHEIQAYLRWVANCDKPFQNINNLKEEKNPAKFIEETIRYKNIEWSFSCSHEDRKGHKDKFEGVTPHYHFQMKVNEQVVINYNGFHIPFDEYDEFVFAIKEGKFDQVKEHTIHGAGMQELLDLKPEDIIENMRMAEDENNAQLHTSIMITADEGTTISGEKLADLIKERNETGVSMAKLVKKLENTKAQILISPGSGVSEIAKRDRNRGGKK